MNTVNWHQELADFLRRKQELKRQGQSVEQINVELPGDRSGQFSPEFYEKVCEQAEEFANDLNTQNIPPDRRIGPSGPLVVCTEKSSQSR